jgi:hypothetical protein
MALNLFDPPTKDDIKVAYIDPILGLVRDVSICDANIEAQKNPGTVFIFRDGNQTLKYLNINEVNNLNPDDLVPTKECEGINSDKEVGPPTIQIFGGGGIGAAGNPVVGNDGAILAVDVVRGGNGYQYPPIVSARDAGSIGSGAVLSALIGCIDKNIETPDPESPQICPSTEVGYGKNWGANGENLGDWDPKTYFASSEASSDSSSTNIFNFSSPGETGSQTRDKIFTPGNYNITFTGLLRDFKTVNNNLIEMVDNDTNDTNASFKLDKITNINTSGIIAKFEKQGSKGARLVVTGTGEARIQFTLSWDDDPISAGDAIDSIIIETSTPTPESENKECGVVTEIIVIDPGNGYIPPNFPSLVPPIIAIIIPDIGIGTTGIGIPVPPTPGIPVPPTPGIPVPPTPGIPVPPTPGIPVPPTPGIPVPPTPGTPVPPTPGTPVPPTPGTPVPPTPGTPVPSPFIPSPPSGAPTGINASFRPQFEVIRDPIVIDPQKLLQVTDLVGLKQTGYVNGRAYYGAVYYDRGIRYAGFYETVGEPVQVYDTLRESIIAQVTTPPSAILRQGTDIRSNDPLLNIPGTVQSTLSSNSIVGAGDIFPPSVPFVQEPVQDPIYQVSLRLKSVIVENSGINYNVTDQIRVIPSNGAVLEPVFGSFGRVIKVAVIDPGFGFTEYPRIEMFTPL